MKMQVVLHRNYGGFGLTPEMANWLVDNKGWQLIDYNYKEKYPLETINIENYGSDYYCPNQDKIEFRSHPDLIECVKHFKKVHENDKYPDSYYGLIHSLKIVEVKVSLEIEQYNDGYERVTSEISTEKIEDN